MNSDSPRTEDNRRRALTSRTLTRQQRPREERSAIPVIHRILIVEDHPLLRSAIKQLLTKALGKVVVSEARDAQEALHLVRSQSLDMAILDISLQGRSGTDLNLLRELKRVSAGLRILVLSMVPEEHYAVRVFQSGGNGYLRKNADPREVIRAIKKVLDGEEYVSDAVAQHLALEAKSDTIKLPHETLSSRESQVFQLLVAGRGITQIAETLKLNVTTVSTYRARILEKIDTKTNAD
ncbi:MAG TPA: response regulator transcription factor, partial [Nitrospira sp.]|nr:response regulator transcription factor [Nitrospira sp.]